MSNYLDLFLRDNLGEANTLPRHGGKTQSPDVITNGVQPANDPGTQFGDDTYDQSLGKPVVYGQQNYVYVRGKNYGSALAVGTVSLYAAYQTQLSTPGAWKQLSTAGGSTTASAAAAADGIAVTTEAFVWNPTQPADGNPYILIAVIATQNNPDPVPDYKKTPGDFTKWQARQGGVAALTIAIPVPPKPKPTYAFSALVNLGNAEPVNASFNLAWTGAVVGDLVSLSADSPGTTGPIGFEDFVITTPNQNTGFSALVAANYSSVVQYQYKSKAGNKIPAPTLTLTVSTVQEDQGGGSGDDPFGGGGTGTTTETLVATYTFKTVLAAS